ncbi:MAG: DUF115 domain-containing protein [Gammaproteobacteria bacterium]|nr:DUF115 domain-containing protein [Gammaproteobacteria bacterium]
MKGQQTLNSAESSFLTNRFGETYLHAVNRDAFNKIGSQAVFQQQLPDNLWAEDRLHIIIGTDSGLLIRHIQAHGVPPGSRFLFIELTEIIELVKQRIGDLPAEPRITLTTPEFWQQTAQDADIDTYVYLDQVQLLKSVGATDAYLPTYRDLHTSVEGDLKGWIWALRSQLASSSFIQCQLDNLAENRLPATCLKGAFSGHTAVLLAGGPSLDDILPWVRQYRADLLVVAVSRIARRLLEDGIQPDIVCTIDPTRLSFDVSREMLNFDPQRVLLVNAYHTYPPLLSQWRGNSLFLGPTFPWSAKTQDDNLPVIGPTVSNTAIALLMEMGVAQIIFAGLDLCTRPDGSRYAAGSNESQVGHSLGLVGLRVPTNAGGMSDTSEDFMQSIHDIGRQAVSAREQGIRLINPSPHAARIAGIEYLQLEEIDLPPTPRDICRQITALLPASDRQARLGHYRQTEHELRHIENQLRKIRALSQDALHYNDGLFGRNGRLQSFKYKHKMDKVEKHLNRDFPQLSELVKRFGIRQFLRILRTDGEREWSDEEVEETGRTYYESYRDGADRLLGLIKDALTRLHSRIAEENEPVDLDALADQWRADEAPGRGRVWRHHHQTILTEQEQATLDQLAAEFDARINEQNTPHMARCRQQAGLENVASKAALLFRQGDHEGLRNLADALGQLDGHEATELHHLVLGQLAESENRDDDALQAYQQIGAGPLLEDALSRISSLCLAHDDFDNARLAFDCLSQISPGHLPQYAELMRITGRMDEAAELYARYLEQVPEDLSTMLRLGRLYQENDVIDGARWAFDYVLQRDPDNRAARSLREALPTECPV